MRVLVACEYSGVVRDAFSRQGHHATSVDLLESETRGEHYVMDIFKFLTAPIRFDLIIAHPPCTYLAVSGNRWYAGSSERVQALAWTADLWDLMRSKADRVCLENPVGVLVHEIGPAAQYIQPYEFGSDESKKTGLWLHNLPKLRPTHERPQHIKQSIWRMPPGPDRGKERSRFWPGIAEAMAIQWGNL